MTGMVPAGRVYEDDDGRACAASMPQALTHMLVVPKEHIASMGATGQEHTL